MRRAAVRRGLALGLAAGALTQAALAGPRPGADARTRGLMRFIGALEAPGGYDDYYRGVRIPPSKPLTTMTVDAVLGWQARAGRVSVSTAAGRYQIIGKTLRKLKLELSLSGHERFDEALQDRMAVRLMADAGWDPKVKPTNALGTALARVWAALPIMSGPNRGLSVYQGLAGNEALTTPAIFARVLSKPGDPKVVAAAISASGKSTRVLDTAGRGFWRIATTARSVGNDDTRASMTPLGPPRAFGAYVIEGGRLTPSRVIVFASDPFALN